MLRPLKKLQWPHEVKFWIGAQKHTVLQKLFLEEIKRIRQKFEIAANRPILVWFSNFFLLRPWKSQNIGVAAALFNCHLPVWKRQTANFFVFIDERASCVMPSNCVSQNKVIHTFYVLAHNFWMDWAIDTYDISK